MKLDNPVFCALDTTEISRAIALARDLEGRVGGIKLGMEFFNAQGPAGYQAVAETGLPIFLDLKLHDIPNTVAGGIRAVLPLKPAIVNVHTAGGSAMMRAAADAAKEAGPERPLIIGVTMLTSLDQADLADTGVSGSPADHVRRLAALAASAGLDGVVCSAHEIELLRRDLGPDFKLIVPGIRPAGSDVGDQKRVMTPSEALSLGADILVIGRPITGAGSPRAAAEEIGKSLAA
ncbi:orotidine-5'-phosphate decarboxylase [Parvibaculum sp.]|jgi:orotidine-5'-phosphate decarboxylase|uniref:orotidine-5'-phosphate decarboxylase n=1 Tax=Parvibaculum sp. TaxID=2024848 RepID=UPI001B058B47|nr:orotidine-5'-phosphate decarboxylase [Parvibaculum sp.]MBO6632960.1 orotidine-5'-phosphate decarboxylase [Parvibaculum sp.]MBO6677739.1 orotidine-5'-phosphate decarboxylase [Parvibaculum sp.]MBO6685150.1 orotidine-5'-phosphate decarboxylase [Parvibaculum sp.]MBO6903340.1 orotidine-5'-phosphate decarboxylase [Parvibaculum sp.]